MRVRAPFLAHDVWQEDAADGTIRLGSRVPIGEVVRNTGAWVHRWAGLAPGRVFVAERSGEGWRTLAFGALLQQVRAVAAALAGRGLGPGTPIAILSGPGVEHAVLTLAAQYVGVPVVPLAEPYSLVEAAHPRLVQAIGAVRPRLVFAAAAGRFGRALGLDCLAGVEVVAASVEGSGATPFSALLRGDAGAPVDALHAAVGPESVAKILFTSGSTSMPKGVVTTQRMLCVNQAQMFAVMPLLSARPPRMLDWLPWNHTFGGSHNFNMMLAGGGSLYLDGGKPTAAGVAETLRNVREQAGTISCNVPIGFSLLVSAMREDAALRRAYFADLDLIFYAAAAVTQEVWDALAAMARAETGAVPLMFGAWGMTETAPAATICHAPPVAAGSPAGRPGNIGVPLPGVVLKLVPEGAGDEGRYGLLVSGPNVMPGYHGEPAATRAAFDAEGFLVTGDAVRLIDAADAGAGLAFDGRMAEDFKLATGTWVRATSLRLQVLEHFTAYATDLVVTGHDRAEVGVLVFVDRGALAAAGIAVEERDGALWSPGLAGALRASLAAAAVAGAGSSMRIGRAMALAAGPSMASGELTAKGSVNARQVLAGRAALVARLYDDGEPCVVRLGAEG